MRTLFTILLIVFCLRSSGQNECCKENLYKKYITEYKDEYDITKRQSVLTELYSKIKADCPCDSTEKRRWLRVEVYYELAISSLTPINKKGCYLDTANLILYNFPDKFKYNLIFPDADDLIAKNRQIRSLRLEYCFKYKDTIPDCSCEASLRYFDQHQQRYFSSDTLIKREKIYNVISKTDNPATLICDSLGHLTVNKKYSIPVKSRQVFKERESLFINKLWNALYYNMYKSHSQAPEDLKRAFVTRKLFADSCIIKVVIKNEQLNSLEVVVSGANAINSICLKALTDAFETLRNMKEGEYVFYIPVKFKRGGIGNIAIENGWIIFNVQEDLINPYVDTDD